MKKPVILLVDDELPVLEALEASLTLAFEGICRIEAFDSPNDAIQSLSVWEHEARPVAVAVVDQKMPRMTGLELLEKLGNESACSHMKSIVLTGYSGLQLALSAKNEAGVDQYTEKPWDADELTASVAMLLTRHLVDSGTDQFLRFREERTKEGILGNIALRFEVSRRTLSLPYSRAAGVDLDCYDSVSDFFSTYCESFEGSQLCAALRVIRTEAGHAGTIPEEIAVGNRELHQRLHAPRDSVFPITEDKPLHVMVLDLIDEGKAPVELGQLALHPAFLARARLVCGGLAREILARSLAALYFVLQIHSIFTLCRSDQSRRYRGLGFKEIDDAVPRFRPDLGAVARPLLGNQAMLTDDARTRLHSLAARLQRTGEACLCATFPDCLGKPYETGVFDPTDLFCPVRAKDILGGAPPSADQASNPDRIMNGGAAGARGGGVS